MPLSGIFRLSSYFPPLSGVFRLIPASRLLRSLLLLPEPALHRAANVFADKAVPGIGGSFTFYELGENLFNDDGNLNAAVSEEKIREYVWYMETKLPLPVPRREAENKLENKTESGSATQNVNEDKTERNIKKGNNAFLGIFNHTAYYFYYNATGATTLDHEFLSTVKTKAESYVLYADACALGEGFLTKHHITFKKIPRDIERL